MNTSTQGYGLTTFPTVTGSKAITNGDVATKILAEFGNLEKNLSQISPIPGNEVIAAKLWGQLSTLRAEFVDVYSGHMGNA